MKASGRIGHAFKGMFDSVWDPPSSRDRVPLSIQYSSYGTVDQALGWVISREDILLHVCPLHEGTTVSTADTPPDLIRGCAT